MANSESIKKYLIESDKPYLDDDANNGNILMLSGTWGSGKTHFWKNIIEKDLIPKIKEKEKSYIFVSLYGKDSIEELQNEILQKSYSFVHHQNTDVISQTYSVFTKMTNLMPKITIFGAGKQIEELNKNEKLRKGTEALLNGGIICFDDFERKSSKIDLNDLFGFITNLTENFNTKTIIITNQEVFHHHDQKVFNTVKEKSVNKFILYNPTIEELFDVIYQDKKYKPLESYKSTILEAIQLSEEKNARIYIQVVNNCLEYAEKVKDVNERTIYLLTLTTIIFVKHNLILRMKNQDELFLLSCISEMPEDIQYKLRPDYYNDNLNSNEFISKLTELVSSSYATKSSGQGMLSGSSTKKSDILLNEILTYISKNKDILFVIYKYVLKYKCFQENNLRLLEKINDFVESGILLEE